MPDLVDEFERRLAAALAARNGPPPHDDDDDPTVRRRPPVFTRIERRLADVAPEAVTWLWDGYLPLGKLVVLDGDPSTGKSTLALDVGARITAKAPMPDGTSGIPGAVVIMSAEDGLADTIRPRLDAAGADVTKVVAITGIVVTVNGVTVERPPAIPDDIAQLEQSVVENEAVLVVIDVLTAFLSSETNSYRDQDVRRALAPLAAMAERTGCCVIVLRHLRKGGGASAIYAGGGSIAIVGAARVGLMAAFDPDDDDVDDLNERRRVLAMVKNNVGRMAPSLSYRIVEAGQASRIDWLGAVAHRADDLVDREHRDDERNDKERFLRDLLADGGVEFKDVEKAARANGWSVKQIRPTLKRLGGTSRPSGFQGPVVWRLPASDDSPSHFSNRESVASLPEVEEDALFPEEGT